MRVLVLNADYSLLEIASWRRAICLLVADKVQIVERYAGRFVHSATRAIPVPAVVIRTTYVSARKRLRFSRKNVLARDGYTCSYCGARPRRPSGAPDLAKLTIDHVVPRAQAEGGHVVLPWSKQRVPITSWRNVVTACSPCNAFKADRTPQEAGLKLRWQPRKPSPMDIVGMALLSHEIPEEWQEYLPADSPWRDYWDVELDPA